MLAAVALAACGSKKAPSQRAVAVARKAPATPGSGRYAPPPPPAPQAPLPRAGADGVYEAGGMRYLVRMTGGAKIGDRVPMVVDFHGHGGRPETHQKRYISGIHDRARFIIPYGFTRADQGFEWFTQGNGYATAHSALARELPQVSQRVARGVDAIAAAWPTRGKPVITGVSQGAVVAYSLAVLHPNEISWACPVSGQVPPQVLNSAHPVAPLPEVHGFHGDQDHLIDIHDGRHTVRTLQRLGYVADLREYRGHGHNDLDLAIPDIQSCLSRGIRKVRGR